MLQGEFILSVCDNRCFFSLFLISQAALTSWLQCIGCTMGRFGELEVWQDSVFFFFFLFFSPYTALPVRFNQGSQRMTGFDQRSKGGKVLECFIWVEKARIRGAEAAAAGSEVKKQRGRIRRAFCRRETRERFSARCGDVDVLKQANGSQWKH